MGKTMICNATDALTSCRQVVSLEKSIKGLAGISGKEMVALCCHFYHYCSSWLSS